MKNKYHKSNSFDVYITSMTVIEISLLLNF